MKLFLLGTALFSGGSAVAMQNENINENVSGMYQQVRERVQKRVKQNIYQNIREEGFSYPASERLENLTEDQQVAILTTIDQINATYDWSDMTDEEIKEALDLIKIEMGELSEELGIEIPENYVRNRFQRRVRNRTNQIIKDRLFDDLKTEGIEYPNDEFLANLTDEQSSAILTKIDEFNTTYNWATMTDEEIYDALTVVRTELHELNEELDILPFNPEQPCIDEEPVTNTDSEL